MLKVIGSEAAEDEVDGRSLLDEIAREGARRMLLAALETEVAAYLEAEPHPATLHAPLSEGGRGAARASRSGALPTTTTHLLPLVRAGIGFVDGVQPEGKASKPKAKAA
jgi:hypothetical protein